MHGVSLRHAVLVDDDARHVAYNEYNSVQIEIFGSEMGADGELSRVMHILRDLSEVEDV